MHRLLAAALLASTFGANAHAQPEPLGRCYEPRESFMEELRALGGIIRDVPSTSGRVVKEWTGPDGRWLRMVLAENAVCVLDVGDDLRLAPQPEQEP